MVSHELQTVLDLSSFPFVDLNLKCSHTPDRLEAAILFTHDIKIRTEPKIGIPDRCIEPNEVNRSASKFSVHRTTMNIDPHEQERFLSIQYSSN